jgi:hypothetical protein
MRGRSGYGDNKKETTFFNEKNSRFENKSNYFGKSEESDQGFLMTKKLKNFAV